MQLWNQLRVKDGLLWQVYKSVYGTITTLKLVVLGKYRQQIVQELHSGALDGHLGADKAHGIEGTFLLAWVLEQSVTAL